jgi:hypothetical protein
MAVFNADSADTIIHMQAIPGQELELDASGSSDPDGDNLDIQWWIYREAGTYDGEITIPQFTEAATALTIPNDALGKEIHLILEVQDENDIISLRDYRRVVIDVVEEVSVKDRNVRPSMHHGLVYRNGSLALDRTAAAPASVSIRDLTGRIAAQLRLHPGDRQAVNLGQGMYFLSLPNTGIELHKIIIR